MPKPERLPSGSYRIRYTDPWGRRRAVTRKTAADARAAYRKILGDMQRGEYTDPRKGRVTFADWCDDWLEGARNLGQGGRDTYRRDLDRHILPKLGGVPIGRLAPADIDQYLTEQQGRRLAASTVHRHYRTIHRALAVAVDRGLIAKNPAKKVKPPKLERREITILTVEQIDALADNISPRYRAWVFIAAYGGLRWSESIGLRRMDIDGPTVRVATQLVRRTTRDTTAETVVSQNPEGPIRRNQNDSSLVLYGQGQSNGWWDRCETKTGKPRTITLPAFAADELATHLEQYSLPGPDGLVFPTRNGTPPQAPSWTANTFRRALHKAGLPPMRVHDLRHAAVSLAIHVGANPVVSQQRAGHSSASVHQDVYGHLMAGADQAIADALDQLRAESRRGRLRAV